MTSSLAPSDTPEGPSEDSSNFALHILCPSLPSPNRFTFNDLTESTTIGDLKSQISQTIPNHPSPLVQRLIYRGKPLVDDSVTLQSLLEPTKGSEYSMHLVLPPAPSLQSASNPTPLAQETSQSSTSLPTSQSNPTPSEPVPPPPYTPNGQGLRYRGPMLHNEAEIGLALRRNIEAIRRQVEQQGSARSLFSEQHRNAASSGNPFSPTLASPQPQFPWRRPQVVPNAPFTPPSQSTMAPSPSQENVRMHLHMIQTQIALCEEQLNRGAVPSMDLIIMIRSQLFAVMDDKYRNPYAERDGTIEALLSRIFNVYTRADQLRVAQARTPHPTAQVNHLQTPSGNSQPQPSLYLLNSPSGYQALVSPHGAEHLRTSLDALRSTHGTQAVPVSGPEHPPQGQPNAQQDAMVNAVRQAVINNQRVVVNEQVGLARNIRRVWLFVRLYFFCYMFSEPGTWDRIFLVAMAVIVAILSETTIPQQLYRMAVSPVQRHLEGLVNDSPDGHPGARAPTSDATAPPNPANNPAPARASLPAELHRNFRRVERSLALFIASLVPGVGERHVEVRNAAEAARNAERVREEEEQRRGDEQANRDGDIRPDPETDAQPSQAPDAPNARPEPREQNPLVETDTAPLVDTNEGR